MHTSTSAYSCYFPVLTELARRRRNGPDPSYRIYGGGDERARTADPHVANVVLSQLSYIPTLSLFRISRDSLSTRIDGGEAGIRTLGTPKCSTVFETAPFNHSGTSPTYRANWRRVRDSNPGYLAVHTISSRADSTALATLRPFRRARNIAWVCPKINIRRRFRLKSREDGGKKRAAVRRTPPRGCRQPPRSPDCRGCPPAAGFSKPRLPHEDPAPRKRSDGGVPA